MHLEPLQGVVVAEQERVVQVVVGPSGTILDCQAGRRKYHLLEALMAEVTGANKQTPGLQTNKPHAGKQQGLEIFREQIDARLL